jgi:hypothetical protein
MHQAHSGKNFAMNSNGGGKMHARSAPYLKKEQVTLTDVTIIKSNEALSNEAQVIRMGPNGAGVYNSTVSTKP